METRKIIREIRFWGSFILIAVIWGTALNSININESKNSIIEFVENDNYFDSLYLDHLCRCSMILRDDVKIDENGYFYSDYEKKYGWHPEREKGDGEP
jgi:hypothetical protein